VFPDDVPERNINDRLKENTDAVLVGWLPALIRNEHDVDVTLAEIDKLIASPGYLAQAERASMITLEQKRAFKTIFDNDSGTNIISAFDAVVAAEYDTLLRERVEECLIANVEHWWAAAKINREKLSELTALIAVAMRDPSKPGFSFGAAPPLDNTLGGRKLYREVPWECKTQTNSRKSRFRSRKSRSRARKSRSRARKSRSRSRKTATRRK